MNLHRGVFCFCLAGFLSIGSTSGACGQAAAPAMEHVHAKAAPSTMLSVTAGGKTVSLSIADLAGMPQKTATVHNAHRNVDETYSGVVLLDVLAKAGAGDASFGKALLRSYVKASGTDGYWVVFSGIEIEAASHVGDVIVATMVDGKALGENGAFQLVSTEDRKPQRWVRNLAGVALVTAQ